MSSAGTKTRDYVRRGNGDRKPNGKILSESVLVTQVIFFEANFILCCLMDRMETKTAFSQFRNSLNGSRRIGS